jgi:MoaA/NifB/PqqE/SkfB family radical SAM enzyme
MTSESLEYILKTLINFRLDLQYHKMKFNFCGGEPLLNFDTLNMVYPEIYKKCKHIGMFSIITTNLTILPNDFVKFYHTVNPDLQVSLNSLTFSKPYKNGKSSSADVLKNLEILLQENVSPRINTVLMTADKGIDELDNFAEYISEKKFRWHLGLEFEFNGDFSDSLCKIKKCINILRKNKYDLQNLFKFNGISKNLLNTICFSTANNKSIYPYFPITGIGSVENLFDVLNKHYKYNYGVFYYDMWEKCKTCSIRKRCCIYTIIPSDRTISDTSCKLSIEITKYLDLIC